jgi:hypothetical protein
MLKGTLVRIDRSVEHDELTALATVLATVLWLWVVSLALGTL